MTTRLPIVVWWWPVGNGEAEFDVPAPHERRFEEVEPAVEFAEEVSVAGGIEWVRCFGPTERESHYRWKRVL